MTQIYLSIGSNIEPELHFKRCASMLEAQFEKLQWSPLYRSEAVGMVGDDFLNAVVSAQTALSLEQLGNTLNTIETDLGRVRSANKFSSRTMDIDLLLYDDLVVNSSRINLPRDEIVNTAHVLVPLVDLIPNAVHPVVGKTYKSLLAELADKNPTAISDLTVVSVSLSSP